MVQATEYAERPRLRGVLHQYAFAASVGLTIALALTAPGPRERLAVLLFGSSLVLSFGASALYHSVTWRPAARRLLRRLDHAGIYLLIAGTYTPYGLLVLTGAWRLVVIGIVWTGAAVAVLVKVTWVDAPKWVAAAFGIGLGWVGAAALPQIHAVIGWAGLSLVFAGGVLYTAGAIVYVRRSPDPAPTVFGYHEVFHALTVLAAACQASAIAFFVVHGR
jgi:hemolysin III